MKDKAALQNIKDFAEKTVGISNIFINEPMKNHTSFKTGGPADILVTPENINQLAEIIKFFSENGVSYFVMGNGTNLLVKDKGYRGVIIKILDKLSSCSVTGRVIKAEAGALLSSVSKAAYDNGLTGLEFAEGIPGTMGGAVAMNAGAYGGEMKDVVTKVAALDCFGKIIYLDKDEMGFGYRKSAIQKRGLVCLSAEMTLEYGGGASIKSKMDENKNNRRLKQPLEMPSAGSTFKRPEGNFAGKLISEAGLRGFTIGGAAVSEKHCGFVVNSGGATSDDIIKLIEHIQKTVSQKFGVTLEPEVKIIGE